MRHHLFKRLAVGFVVMALSLVFGAAILLEGITQALMSPTLAARLPTNGLTLSRRLYARSRAMPVFLPQSGRFDSQLFYTLRPGVFRHRAKEFDVEVSVNSLGVRDDELSVVKPEIIILGDSFTMGWGVAFQSTYGRLIAKATGRRVLAAAVPSYGTVREKFLLERIDTSHTRLLIVQYNDNDYFENAYYQARRYQMEAQPKDYYESIVKSQMPQGFGFVTQLLLRRFHLAAPTVEPSLPVVDFSESSQAERFLDALEFAGKALPPVPVLVFDAITRGNLISPFIAEIRNSQQHHARRGLHIRLLDIASVQTKDRYFLLDDHWNAQGHAVVARLISDFIRDNNL